MYRYTCSTYHELWKQICDFTIAYNIIKWSVDVSVCWHFGLSTCCPVDVLVCRRFGLSTFWFVDVSVCRRFGLSTFWFVDVLVCRRFGLSTFRFVDVLVCRRFGCRRFGLSTFWPVTIGKTHYRGEMVPYRYGELYICVELSPLCRSCKHRYHLGVANHPTLTLEAITSPRL